MRKTLSSASSIMSVSEPSPSGLNSLFRQENRRDKNVPVSARDAGGYRLQFFFIYFLSLFHHFCTDRLTTSMASLFLLKKRFFSLSAIRQFMLQAFRFPGFVSIHFLQIL